MTATSFLCLFPPTFAMQPQNQRKNSSEESKSRIHTAPPLLSLASAAFFPFLDASLIFPPWPNPPIGREKRRVEFPACNVRCSWPVAKMATPMHRLIARRQAWVSVRQKYWGGGKRMVEVVIIMCWVWRSAAGSSGWLFRSKSCPTFCVSRESASGSMV